MKLLVRLTSKPQLILLPFKHKTKLFDKFKTNHFKLNRLLTSTPQKQHDSENVILTIPNCLTMSRIASIPFINYFVFTNQHELACGLFFLAGFTDLLDGYIARNFKNQKSHLGSIIDPLADKLLIGTLTVTLTLNSMLPIPLAILILGRDLSLILYSLYVRYKLIDKPVTFSKYINIKESRIKVEADMISKINTFLQIILITATLPSNVFLYNDSIFLIALQYLTGLTTIASSISYMAKRGSYKVIDKPNRV
ncbi:unnamed protein product [Brachionus calyciflorus]|uniref:cardiolipin synthase (CMP-forming) n=1 Tax=Brachionus calyciflorus TaxID=104777 RepID=A0A814B735_9BILA|nr:unnamed protein product [Brachionus calyciflorus]